MSQNPYVFIVGCARSGTTLLRRIVDAHPHIAITPPIHWIVSFRERDAHQTAGGIVTKETVYALLEHRRFPQLEVSRGEFEGLIGPDETLSCGVFLARFFGLYAQVKGKPLVGNKTPVYVRRISTLHTIWPQARFVHLIRDGRGVCLSIRNWAKAPPILGRYSTWTKDPVSTIALWWKQKVRQGREAGSLLGSKLYHEIRYESLVANPAEECKALCAFLALPYDDAMLRFYEERTKTEADVEHPWLPITPGLRDWRTQMAVEDVERFEAVAGDLLEELQYPRAVRSPEAETQRHAALIQKLFIQDARPRRARTLPKGRRRPMSQNPYLFIVGCPRSGTTLLQRMLDHHPLLAVANDTHFIPKAIEGVHERGDLPLTPDLIKTVCNYHRFFRLRLSEADVSRAAENSFTYREFVTALYSEYGRLRKKPFAGEKTPDYVKCLPLLHALFPWVKTVHIIRDGRDVALSTLQWAQQDKGPGKFELWSKETLGVCALWWQWQVSTGQRGGADLGSERYHEVRYESLVRQPAEVLQDITQFLELPFAPEMLTYHKDKVRPDPRLRAKSAWLPPTPGLRDWRTQMCARDIELFEAIAGDLLTKLGYERAFNTISPEIANVAEQCRLWWETAMMRRSVKRANRLSSKRDADTAAQHNDGMHAAIVCGDK